MAATQTPPPDEVLRAVEAGALVVLNDSGGKDSNAQALYLSRYVPAHQRLHVHATLGESEWDGAEAKAREVAQHTGAEFMVVQAKFTFLEMVTRRFQVRPGAPCWPSPQYRTCTSDLKRNVINSAVKRVAKERGVHTIINAMGLRAEESKNRAAKPPCMVSDAHSIKERTLKSGQTRAGRTWIEYLPIHAFRTEEVFGTIADAGLDPHHAYALGNERMSCVFCIMGCRSDLQNGAKHHPALYQKYAQLEAETGWMFHPSRKSLPMLTGISVKAPLPLSPALTRGGVTQPGLF